jgi:DNA-binding beta-propeller fold protein YncE
MRLLRHAIATLLAAAYGVAFLSGVGCGGGSPPEHEAAGAQLFESPQADALVLSPDGTKLYMAHTTMGLVRVFDTSSLGNSVLIDVGTDPVSLAIRPDGTELWVANHVSDSISVVSLEPGPLQHKVVETIQAVDTGNLITDFDEPVGIVFASNSKAYVSLSSRNQVAIVDADAYSVTGFLPIHSQEPRAMVARNGRLYVPSFESGNTSELSSCIGEPVPGDTSCTFNFATSNFATNPQLLGLPVDIVPDAQVPDRDLYVFDTSNDQQIDVVSGIGTLLYGLAVDSNEKVFIAQTDARNLVNGRAGTQGKGLVDLENRMFLNQVGVVSCPGGNCGAPSRFELEPLPPSQPSAGSQLATPYGIAVSGDDQVLIVTAASSARVAAVDAVTGQVLDVIDVGNGPRAVALRSDPGTGAPLTAYVLNTLDNSVSELDLTGLAVQGQPPTLVETRRKVFNNDTTPVAIRSGRIAFNNAAASTTGTFSCGSCHPDGHVDQLLWVIGAQCTFSANCNQEEARSTMPVRGLRGTVPLHWDGALGDPIGLTNGEVGPNLSAPANCSDDQSCFRHLVNASLGGVMCDQEGGCPTNDIGQPGGLSNADRDAMATYLQNIQYPPARMRRFDDVVTASAAAGFSQFFEDVGGQAVPQTCADNGTAPNGGSGCHALPWSAGTNSTLVGGFEAPTMRGLNDRYLQFSAGVTNVRDLLQAAAVGGATEVPWSAAVGYDELTVYALAFGTVANPVAFRAIYNADPFDTFQMVEEMSTGQSGALGRQVTLNLRSTEAGQLAATQALLAALETADLRGLVNLNGFGIRDGASVQLSFRSDGTYKTTGVSLTRAQLIAEAQAGATLLTLTAEPREGVNAGTVPPIIFFDPAGGITTGAQPLPQFNNGSNPVPLTSFRAKGVVAGAQALIDGVPVALDVPIACRTGGTLPNCTGNNVLVDLTAPPASVGIHFLQLVNPDGLVSNEMPVRRN